MKPHRTDLVSLVPGLLLTAVAVLALTDGLHVDLFTAEWAWPALLIALGVVVLASAGWGRRPTTEPTEPTEPTDSAEPTEPTDPADAAADRGGTGTGAEPDEG